MKIKNGNFLIFFSSKPNQKFQKVFLANQKIRKKKKKIFPLLPLLVLLHPKAINPNNINNPLYQNNISN